jgi:hypothetical protein
MNPPIQNQRKDGFNQACSHQLVLEKSLLIVTENVWRTSTHLENLP